MEMQPEKHYHFNWVFIAACAGMLLFGIVMLTLGSSLPEIIKKYVLDDVSAGSLASLLPTGILLGSLLFGPIVDRFSYQYLLVVCTLLISSGMYGISSASGLVALQVSFFMIGLGGGAINGCTNALVADISQDHQKTGSANLSLLGVFFGIGALTIPSVMAILSKTWTYDQIFLRVAVLMLAPLLFFLSTKFPKPKQSQRISISKSMSLFKDRNLLILAFILFFQSAFEGIFNNWTTTFLQRIKNFNEAEALTALSIYVLGITITRLLLAALLRVINERLILYISIICLMVGVSLMLVSSKIIHIYLGTTALGIGTAAVFPTILAFVGELYQSMRGTAFSVVIFIAVTGNIMINFLMGILSDRVGIQLYPAVLFFCVIMIFLIFKFYDRQNRTITK